MLHVFLIEPKMNAEKIIISMSLCAQSGNLNERDLFRWKPPIQIQMIDASDISSSC